MNSKTFLCFLGAIAFAAQSATINHTGWFRFPMAWNDTSHTITDQSWSVEAPAGKYGFLQTTPDGHFKFQNDLRRVRFNGFVNVTSSNYPDSADAPLIAARLRKLGTNFLRIHLIDNDWGSAVYQAGDNTRTIDPVRMRNLDWFLKCLRDQGIYYNFCVQSARVFKSGDTIPATVTNDMGKIVSLFDPRLIQIEKSWAAQLAQHVNPFTGLAYKDDPAVATWELTNENQLFQAWLSWGSYSHWDSTSATNAVGMAPYYYHELDTLWNRWLGGKYPSDLALRSAWAGPVGTAINQIANPSFETGINGWAAWYDPKSTAGITMNQGVGGYGSLNALTVTVASQGTNDFDANVNYTGLSVIPGKGYRFRFFVKGSVPTTLRTEFLQDFVWTWFGDNTCQVGTDWSECDQFFVAPIRLDGDFRVNLDFGHSEGTIRIDSASFMEFAGDGLRTNESLANGSVKRSSRSTIVSLSAPRYSDEERFYADLESKYISGLGGFLKDSIGIKVPVTFTNNWYGLPSIASQSKADYIDAHWYWDHPYFPAGWSDVNFIQQGKPMIQDPDWGTIPGFSLSRVKDKPFFGSEYNHPWPNQYLCEATAFYYGYMGFLDADGALLHAYYDGEPLFKSTAYMKFFNSGMNPILVTQQHLARLFRTGKISPTNSMTTLDVTEADLAGSAKRLDGSPFNGSVASTLVNPTRWGSFSAVSSSPTNFVDPGTRAVSNTGELDWDQAKGLLKIDNPSWQGLVGFLSAGANTSKLGTSGLKTTGNRDFAAVHLVTSDTLPLSSSRHLLLLTSARMENPGTIWATDFSHTTRQTVAGDTAICEPVKGLVWIIPGRKDSVSVYSLDPKGVRVASLPVVWSRDTLFFNLPGTSLWYEIAKGDANSTVGVRQVSVRGSSLDLRARPGGWDLSVALGSETTPLQLEWDVRDLTGRILASGLAAATSGIQRIPAPRGAGMVLVQARLTGAAGSSLARIRTLSPVTR